MASQQPVPVLLIKATWNERANRENPLGASSLIESIKGQGTETDAVGSNIVPMDGIVCPDSDTVNGHTVQTSQNIEAADNSEPNVNGLHVKTEVLGDTDEPGPSDESEIGLKISGEPWSLAPAVFSGSDEAEPFAVVENIEGDSEMPPDETELLSVINSGCVNVIPNKNGAGIEQFIVVNIEGTQEVVCDSDDVPYTILRNDEYNELSTGENIFTESIEVKDELFPKAENYELIDLPASSDQISNEPVALWNTLCAVNEEGQEIPMPMIGSTISLPNMCSENSYFNDQDSDAWTVEIPLSNPSDACSAANYNTVSEGGQFTIVSGEFGQLGSKVVKIDENKCSDNQLIISSGMFEPPCEKTCS